jgi:hypothetical protein
MRRRSFTGPLLLLVIGALFLWRNLHPEAPVFDIVATYWPFLLIGWGLLRLLEVVIWRDRQWASFSGGEVVLVILICVFGLGIWQARERGVRFTTGGLEVFGEQFDYMVEAKAPAAGVARVVFENPRGNIKVAGGDFQEVRVTGRKTIRAWARRDADQTHEKTPLEIVQQGDRLVVRTNQDRVGNNQRIADDIEVTVPRGVAIEARGRTADYEVTDINGDVELGADRADVRLTRLGGNVRLDIARSDLIRVSDLKGRLDLQGSRGTDLDLENIQGQVTIDGTYTGSMEFKKLAKPLQFDGSRNTQLHVEAIPGRISMDLSQVSGDGVVGPVRLTTRSRDVKLENFTAGLEIDTDRGDLELLPSLPVPAMDIKTGSGRIELVLPGKAAFNLQATVERGEAANEFGTQIVQERVGNRSTLAGKVGEGPTVRLTANQGSVVVRRQGLEGSTAEVPDAPRPPKVPKTMKELKDAEVKM